MEAVILVMTYLQKYMFQLKKKRHKCKLRSTTWNCTTYKKDYSWNPSTCICENDKYLKRFVDDSKIVCDEIIYVIDIV